MTVFLFRDISFTFMKWAFAKVCGNTCELTKKQKVFTVSIKFHISCKLFSRQHSLTEICFLIDFFLIE